MVYVTPAHTYEDALNCAKVVFPRLANIPTELITFSVNVRVNGTLKSVRIAPMAWNEVVSSLLKYEIIDVAVVAGSSTAQLDEDMRQSSNSKNLDATASDAPPTYHTNGSEGN